MDEGNTIRERLRAVEVELEHVKDGLSAVEEELSEFKDVCSTRFGEIETQLQGITSAINNKLRGSLSGAEKAAIVIALITSIGAIIVSLIK